MIRAWVLGGVALAVLAGCDPSFFDPGGGGGGTDVVFNEGFVFVRADANGIDQVMVTDKSDYQEVSALTEGTADASYPSLSRDGRQVVYIEGTGANTVIKTVATTVGSLPRTVLAATGGKLNFRQPVFSPDGSLIVFTYDESTSWSGLGKVNAADGTGFARIVGGTSASYSSPSFYADGVKVLAAFGGTIGVYDQLALNIRTDTPDSVGSFINNLGDATRIEDRVLISPDNTRAVFAGRPSAGGSARIYVANLTASGVSKLTDHPGEASATDSFPAWVSDAQVAFTSDAGGSDQLYLISSTPAASPHGGSLTVPSARQPWYGKRTASVTVAAR